MSDPKSVEFKSGAGIKLTGDVINKTIEIESTIKKSDIGLGNVDNTSDADKPVSTATQTALNNKVDKEAGKGLSEENYTAAEKNKLITLGDPLFQGRFVSEMALQYALGALGVDGAYAYVDPGVGSDVELYIYDNTDDKWVKGNAASGGDFSIDIDDEQAATTLPSTGLVSSILQIVRNALKMLFSYFDSSGNAKNAVDAEYAVNLKNIRQFKVALDSNNSVGFNGGADLLNMGVGGILGILNGGTGRNDGKSYPVEYFTYQREPGVSSPQIDLPAGGYWLTSMYGINLSTGVMDPNTTAIAVYPGGTGLLNAGTSTFRNYIGAIKVSG